MVQKFCTCGEQEGLKGAVHGAACIVAATMALYNLAAWYYRRERHLGTNAVVYSIATTWEMTQTLRHLNRHPPEKSSTIAA